MTRAAALALIWTAIDTIVTLSDAPAVIWAHQTANAPKTPHVRLTAISDDGVGRMYRVDATTLRQARTVDVQIDGIGDGAEDQVVLLDALVTGDHPAVRTLTAAGVSVQARTVVQDLAERGPSGWIARKSLTVTFGYTLEVSATAGPEATAIVIDVEADTDGDGAIDVTIDPLHTETNPPP